jgi:lysophospholipase L1-like esterase
LVVDGDAFAQQTVDRWSNRTFAGLGGELVDVSQRELVTLRFDGLSQAPKNVELWFPSNGIVELCALRADAPVEASFETRPRWIHHGSSISHCTSAHGPTKTWPAVAGRLGEMDLLNLGFSGQCHLDPFVARTIRDLPADFISLKVGINIAGAATLKFRTFGPAVHGFLDTIREGHPDTPILLVSPIICPMLEHQAGPILPDGQGGMTTARSEANPWDRPLSLREMREILAGIVEERSQTDPHLRYLDGLSLFGESDLADLPDGVHPSGDGYIRIGERFAAAVFAENPVKVGA